jgi:hypothetical protein
MPLSLVMLVGDYPPSPMMGTGPTVVWIAAVVLSLAGWWKIFDKAGQPGWAAIIPIYNLFVMLQIAAKPWWWLILLCIPVVNLVVLAIVCIEIARRFGQGAGFGLGLTFLSFIFAPILGFGAATYRGA